MKLSRLKIDSKMVRLISLLGIRQKINQKKKVMQTDDIPAVQTFQGINNNNNLPIYIAHFYMC